MVSPLSEPVIFLNRRNVFINYSVVSNKREQAVIIILAAVWVMLEGNKTAGVQGKCWEKMLVDGQAFPRGLVGSSGKLENVLELP